MRLSVSYIVFDGSELLEHTIRQIREHADFVHVLYQRTSWFGHPLPDEDMEILLGLEKQGLADMVSEFSDFTVVNGIARQDIMTAKSHETRKRQRTIDVALEHGCTHHICMDADEFYVGVQFGKAKRMCEDMDLGLTAARFINYVRTPKLHRGYDANFVPFICRIGEGSRASGDFFVRCDPTRGVSPAIGKNHIFASGDLTMHHMETVRRNLRLKYESTTRLVTDRSRTMELVERIGSAQEHADFGGIIFPNVGRVRLHRCENIFGIPEYIMPWTSKNGSSMKT